MIKLTTNRFTKIREAIFASPKVARALAAFDKAARSCLVLICFSTFKSNWWFRPTGALLSFCLFFVTSGAIKQVHAADAPPPAPLSEDEYEDDDESEDEYEDECPPNEELKNPILLDQIRDLIMKKLPTVEKASDSDLYQVGGFLTNYLFTGEAPRPMAPVDVPIDGFCLLINRQYLTYCEASLALLGFCDRSWNARPISLELNGESAVRLVTGLKVTLSKIGKIRKDFCRWSIDQDFGRNYSISHHYAHDWVELNCPDRESSTSPLDFCHFPFYYSTSWTSSKWTTLLSYPRLKELYEQVRLFRCISITNLNFRVMPEDFSLRETLQLTLPNSSEMLRVYSVRKTITQEWLPSLLERVNHLDSTLEGLPLIHNQLSPELVSSLLRLQALDILPFEVATIVSGQQLDMFLQLMLL